MKGSTFTIRLAESSDVSALRAIYAPYVEKTAITFEVETPEAAEFEARRLKTLKNYPYLVGQEDDKIIGYAYAAPQMERAAYQWNATLSVYLAETHRGRGLGEKLYLALMDILNLQNVINVYGGVTWPNPASEKLHHKLGFTPLGRYARTGYKLGRWHDVVWFEKSLTPAPPSPPLPLRPFISLDPAEVAAILLKYSQ